MCQRGTNTVGTTRPLSRTSPRVVNGQQGSPGSRHGARATARLAGGNGVCAGERGERVAGIEPAWRPWPSGTQQRLGSCARSLRPLGAPPKRSFPGSPMGKRRAAFAAEAGKLLRAIENDASVWLPRRGLGSGDSFGCQPGAGPAAPRRKAVVQESTGPLALGVTSARPQVGGAAHGFQPWGVMSVSRGDRVTGASGGM